MIYLGRSLGNIDDEGDGSSEKRSERRVDRGSELSPETSLW